MNPSIRFFLDESSQPVALGTSFAPVAFRVSTLFSGATTCSFLNNPFFTATNFSWISDVGNFLSDNSILVYPPANFPTLVSAGSHVNMISSGDLFFDTDKLYKVAHGEEPFQMTYKPIRTINVDSQINSVSEFIPVFREF